MRLRLRLARIPDGTVPLVGQRAVMRKLSDASQIAEAIADDAGVVEFVLDGHPDPYYVSLEGVPGGDRYWVSTEAKALGAHALKELPLALRAGGDGVVKGVMGALDCSIAGDRVTVQPGAALIAGHPFVRYNPQSFDFLRPSSGVRTDLLVATVKPEGSTDPNPGASFLQKREGVGTTPGAPVQTADSWDLPLARITVPAGGGALTCTDLRVFPLDLTPVLGQYTVAQSSTQAAAGVVVGSGFSLNLPRPSVYDVVARLTAQQVGVAPIWAEVNGSPLPLVFSNQTPLTICRSPWNGYYYIADYNNGRVIMLTPAGAYYNSVGGYPYIRGIDADSSGYLWFGYYDHNYAGAACAKMDAGTLGLYTLCSVGPGYPLCCATNGTYGWVGTTANVVKITGMSGGSFQTLNTLSFTDPQGVYYRPQADTDGQTYIYIVTRQGKAIYKYRHYDFAFAYAFGGFTDPLGLHGDDAGNLVVADYGANLIRRVTISGGVIDSFTVPGPVDLTNAGGDQFWVGSYVDNRIHILDQTTGGYGEAAIEHLDPSSDVVGDWNGPGNRVGAVNAAEAFAVTGPTTLTLRARHRATFGQAVLNNVQLTATATPRS
jgi:hypothetical protein